MDYFINKNTTTWPDKQVCTKDELQGFFKIDDVAFDRLVRLGAITFSDGSAVETPGTLLIQSVFADARRVESFVNPAHDELMERVLKAKEEYESFRRVPPLDNPGDHPADVSPDVLPDHVVYVPPAPPLPDVIPAIVIPPEQTTPEQPAKPQNSPSELEKPPEGSILPPDSLASPEVSPEVSPVSEAIQPDAIASDPATDSPAVDANAKPKAKRGGK